MLARNAVSEGSPASANVSALAARMERRAEAGRWDEAQELAVTLCAAVMEIPAETRRSALQLAAHSIDRVAAAATSARADVFGELATLRRGEIAKKAYELR